MRYCMILHSFDTSVGNIPKYSKSLKILLTRRYKLSVNICLFFLQNNPTAEAELPLATPNNNHGASSSSHPDLSSIFDKDFDCSVCLEEMAPPTRIFQCR